MATVLVCLAAGLAGCAIGPDYKRPALTPPERFRGPSAAETSSLADLPWWEVFGDPTLRALIQEALAQIGDLTGTLVGSERWEPARAERVMQDLEGCGPAQLVRLGD